MQLKPGIINKKNNLFEQIFLRIFCAYWYLGKLGSLRQVKKQPVTDLVLPPSWQKTREIK